MPENEFKRPNRHTIRSYEALTYFIIERELIRRRKEAGEGEPWTNDPILAKYRFCNVRRRDDRVSRWLIKNLYQGATVETFITAAVSRLINWPLTLAALRVNGVIPCTSQSFNREDFIKYLAWYKSRHDKTFTGAYMIFPTNKFAPKEVGIADSLRSIINNHEIIEKAIRSNMLINTAAELQKCDGIGAFMAGQIVADLTYQPGVLDKADDLYLWAPLGPGSQKGLNVLKDNTPYKGWTSHEFNTELLYILKRWITPNLSFPDYISMTLHDVQNCMCEFSKYSKVILQLGAPRSLYKSEAHLYRAI